MELKKTKKKNEYSIGFENNSYIFIGVNKIL